MQKIRLFLFACVMALPSLGYASELIYLDTDLNPTDKAKATYQRQAYVPNADGLFDMKIYFIGKEQLYFQGQGRFADDKKTVLKQNSGTFFYPNGKVQIKTSYNEKGETHGQALYYLDDGSLRLDHQFANGQRISTQVYDDGEKAGLTTYEYDAKRPDYLKYKTYQQGDLRCVHQQVNGEFDGLQQHYRQGVLEDETHYLNGKKQGEYRRYVDGNLYIITPYVMDKRHGKQTTFFADGKIQRIRYYNHGKDAKESIEYNEAGNVVARYKFDEKGEKYEAYEYNDKGLLTYSKVRNAQGVSVSTRYRRSGRLSSMTTQPADKSQWTEKREFGTGGYLSYYSRKQESTGHYYQWRYANNGLLEAFSEKRPDGYVKVQNWHDNGQLSLESITPSEKAAWAVQKRYNEKGELTSEEREQPLLKHTIEVRYRDGVIQARRERLNGKAHGLQVERSYGGVIVSENFLHGVKNGKYEMRDSKTGQLLTKGQYHQGARTGRWEQWGYSGMPIPEYFLGERRRFGHIPSQEQDEYHLVSHYRNDKLHGTYQFFKGKDQRLISGKFKNGLPVGHWEMRDNDSGTLLYSATVGQTPHGQWTETDFDHEYTLSGRYHKGKAEGAWKFSRVNGLVWLEGTFRHGQPHGTWYVFDKEGRVNCKLNYQKGMPKGDWIAFDYKGKETWRHHFKAGEMRVEMSHADSARDNYWRDNNSHGVPSECYMNISALLQTAH
ncbi:hypothetical protein VST7929_02775 [Vibrio stylophorae]|uniref:Toxin-antitoxin system YwqK family antitoxin n=1 Tax=Vibrio stylophorae TaxID=659351 RepID=A0ABN8DWX2_9VIBR|nr:hypothetical protein [Vibrio stylophorae]CAH0535114.1 hypothetical protein VST7929_02775 [Vibrio stylophorae]